jgi:hypothetical protein
MQGARQSVPSLTQREHRTPRTRKGGGYRLPRAWLEILLLRFERGHEFFLGDDSIAIRVGILEMSRDGRVHRGFVRS